MEHVDHARRRAPGHRDLGRRHNGAGDLSHVVDAETGVMIDPVVVDRVTGVPIGARPMRLMIPVRPAGKE